MSERAIHVGSVSLPLSDFVVSRNAVLGITKSGKTYTSKGIAEQLLDASVPIVVFDAIGVWRHLRTPGTGVAGRGYKIVVAGGAAPDLPLTPASAPEIVRAAIAENIPLIIDLYDSKLSKADWRKIVQHCFRALLYENKGMRHIFLEEAAEYAPQRVLDGETYAEVEKLARMGGNASLGITFINQRAQELNKSVLELCDNVLLLRQRGSHAIDALEKWLDRLSPDTAAEVAKSMPHMGQGDCWVFTEAADRPIRTRSGKLHSYHPDRTKPDDGKTTPRKAVDQAEFVTALTGKLGALVQDRKENDPSALRKQVADLQRELASVKRTPAQVETREVPVLSEAQRELWAQLCVSMIQELNRTQMTVQEFVSELRSKAVQRPAISPAPRPARAEPRRIESNGAASGSLGRAERKILTALAHGAASKRKLAILAGYAINGGGFNNAISSCRSQGLLTGSDPYQITQEGIRQIGPVDPLPTGTALREHWKGQLGRAEALILEAVLDAYPNPIDKEVIAAATGYAASGGGFNNAISKLRSLELVFGRNQLAAAEEFFE